MILPKIIKIIQQIGLDSNLEPKQYLKELEQKTIFLVLINTDQCLVIFGDRSLQEQIKRKQIKNIIMKTFITLLAALFLMSNVAFAQAQWSVDPAHTNARFEIKHLGIAFVDGEFTQLSGQAETKDSTTFDAGTVAFEIDVASIDTRVEARDEHLRSEDFFNAEKFPKMTLQNATFKSAGEGKFQLSGDLTIKDVTKPVTFEVEQNNGVIIDPWGQTRAGFTAKTTINRFDYNIDYDDKTPAGVVALAPGVAIIVNVELIKQ